MPHYRCVGEVPRKRHTVFERDGRRCVEELMGQHGFSSASALLYHRHSPSAIVAIEPLDGPGEAGFRPDHPVVPRHLRTARLDGRHGGGDTVAGRRPLLGNAEVTISHAAVASGTGPLYRNACGDELVYVQRGTATLESVFGRLPVGPGDYVVVPSGATHRWVVDADLELLIVESSGHVTTPARYLSPTGQFLEGSPYGERDLRAPGALLQEEGDDIDVIVKTTAGLTRHVHRHHPFDVVGWDGQLYPWAFNIGDFEPIVGRLHQPPPVHQTFEAPGIVVCSFVPRLYDFDPQAVKVPYHHANTDSDEVLFYSDGDFMSRAGSGIGVGSISFHPRGFVHGPQPGSHEASLATDRTGETAVMIDTFSPLDVSEHARAISDPDYPWSWAGRGP
jgi:homogentisate 1,2-dioxygenase